MTDRAGLGFSEGVAREFAFLADFGYRLVDSGQTRVRYASEHLYVDIVHGRSYGIGVAFGSRHEPAYEISLEEIYQATGQRGRDLNVLRRHPRSFATVFIFSPTSHELKLQLSEVRRHWTKSTSFVSA